MTTEQRIMEACRRMENLQSEAVAIRELLAGAAGGLVDDSGAPVMLPGRRAVRWQGVEAKLTPREYRLLELLIERAGQDVSYETIDARVRPWNLGKYKESAIHKTVGRLRMTLRKQSLPYLAQAIRSGNEEIDSYILLPVWRDAPSENCPKNVSGCQANCPTAEGTLGGEVSPSGELL